LVGQPAPAAYLINYNFYGYAKFKIDPKSVSVFQNDLYKIKDALCRKLVIKLMHDMLKTQDVCGVQLFDLCKTQLVHETSSDVISNCLNMIMPIVIKSYLPTKYYEVKKREMFEMVL
jgi:hypothetical protein